MKINRDICSVCACVCWWIWRLFISTISTGLMTITRTLIATTWQFRTCSCVMGRFWRNLWRRDLFRRQRLERLSNPTLTNQFPILRVRRRTFPPTHTTWKLLTDGIRRIWRYLDCPVVEREGLGDGSRPMPGLGFCGRGVKRRTFDSYSANSEIQKKKTLRIWPRLFSVVIPLTQLFYRLLDVGLPFALHARSKAVVG
jgi:hypothetical protein